MTGSIQKRVDKIERQLGLGNKEPKTIPFRTILSVRESDKAAAESLGPVKEWQSYKQLIARNPDKSFIFQPDPQLELIARQRPLTEDELASLNVLLQMDVV